MQVTVEEKKVEASDRQAHEDAKQRLARAQAELDDSSFNVTRILEKSSKPLSDLLRHEAAHSRSLMRTRHELERLQAKRAGEHVPAPGVVDMNVNLDDPRPDIDETALNGKTDDGKSPIGGRQSG